MAAYCSCCGAEITLKAEACPVCGTPRHGMSKPEAPGRESDGARTSYGDKEVDYPLPRKSA